MNSSFWKFLALSALVVVATGCGEGGPRLYKAGGTVTYNATPLAQADVTFLYDDGNFATGSTDAAGKFDLIYMGRPGGAPLGKCKVTVTKSAVSGTAPPPAGAKPEDMMKAMRAATGTTMQQGGDKTMAKALVPAKYANPDGSGISFEIQADEKANDFKIDLKD